MAVLDAATDRSLVLVDEIVAGTDPVEGSALAQALVARLAAQARLTVVTTHHPELKEWASATAGVANAATALDPETHEPLTRFLFEAQDDHPLWRFRRILDLTNFEEGFARSDITVVNWPQNDYWFGPVVGVDEAECARNLEAARQLSLSLLYWLQTEAPRPDGGVGYPGLRLRGDVVGGTPDGLAPAPYVRESRRIRAEFTVLEQHIAHPLRPDGPELFGDSVGVGCYRIDLHPRVSGAGYLDLGCWPFQIPLGAMIPVRVENLLLIERAELCLGPGLNVLTGETGAGKTVLAHAVDLLLGGKPRASGTIQIWRKRTGSACEWFHSLWTTPLPALMRWTSPGRIVELLPIVSLWPRAPDRTYETISMSRCG